MPQPSDHAGPGRAFEADDRVDEPEGQRHEHDGSQTLRRPCVGPGVGRARCRFSTRRIRAGQTTIQPESRRSPRREYPSNRHALMGEGNHSPFRGLSARQPLSADRGNDGRLGGEVVGIETKGRHGRRVELPGRLQTTPLLEVLDGGLHGRTPKSIDLAGVEA